MELVKELRGPARSGKTTALKALVSGYANQMKPGNREMFNIAWIAKNAETAGYMRKQLPPFVTVISAYQANENRALSANYDVILMDETERFTRPVIQLVDEILYRTRMRQKPITIFYAVESNYVKPVKPGLFKRIGQALKKWLIRGKD